ncbi:MAG: hypothetical protein IPK17_17555 [Chloroflexi bacterium]|uniref:hypothetical protein n=1 Tax=Candidatus Flexifilum breve TaxID=3140694 RepID=UPI003136A96B|nr:hypothetical protein [Chloroflexota bacterium]
MMPGIPIKPAHNNERNPNQFALVVAAEADMRLCSLVELLIDHWKLPLKTKDRDPIGYTLSYRDTKQAIDCNLKTIADLEPLPIVRLLLTSVPKGIVFSSESDMAVFRVLAPDKRKKLTVLSSLNATLVDLLIGLDKVWKLPTTLNGDPVYYVPTPPRDAEHLLSKTLAEAGLKSGMALQLTPVKGIATWSDEPDEAGAETHYAEIEYMPADTPPIVIETKPKEKERRPDHHRCTAVRERARFAARNSPPTKLFHQLLAQRRGFCRAIGKRFETKRTADVA